MLRAYLYISVLAVGAFAVSACGSKPSSTTSTSTQAPAPQAAPIALAANGTCTPPSGTYGYNLSLAQTALTQGSGNYSGTATNQNGGNSEAFTAVVSSSQANGFTEALVSYTSNDVTTGGCLYLTNRGTAMPIYSSDQSTIVGKLYDFQSSIFYAPSFTGDPGVVEVKLAMINNGQTLDPSQSSINILDCGFSDDCGYPTNVLQSTAIGKR
jgi:hypothetical protein